MKTVANGICIIDNAILLVKKIDVWILPGGKVEGVESREECLVRKCSEELPKVKITIKDSWHNFSGITPFTNSYILVKTFFILIMNYHMENMITVAEISEAKFFSLKELSSIKVSDITKDIIQNLIKDGYLS